MEGPRVPGVSTHAPPPPTDADAGYRYTGSSRLDGVMAGDGYSFDGKVCQAVKEAGARQLEHVRKEAAGVRKLYYTALTDVAAALGNAHDPGPCRDGLENVLARINAEIAFIDTAIDEQASVAEALLAAVQCGASAQVMDQQMHAYEQAMTTLRDMVGETQFMFSYLWARFQELLAGPCA